ncbi:MAG: hypothetical protein Q8O13_06535 [Candidatus Omnitrophota bacterium]|nr:hypothetical protein [Candidatus Omnitrophota bacterium]
MKIYKFSIAGKLKEIVRNVLIYGVSIGFLIFISRFARLYYIAWIPMLWLGYQAFCNIFFVCAITFSISEDGISINNILNIVNMIKWNDIKKIETTRRKSKIISIYVYTKIKGWDFFRLWDGIINFEEMANEILSRTKNTQENTQDAVDNSP